MPASPRLTRHFPVKMTDTGFRRLKSFSAETGLSEDEALSFVFENLTGLLDDAALMHRLAAYKERLKNNDQDQ